MLRRQVLDAAGSRALKITNGRNLGVLWAQLPSSDREVESKLNFAEHLTNGRLGIFRSDSFLEHWGRGPPRRLASPRSFDLLGDVASFRG